jgi:enterochelin esterase-like enzyme
MEHRGSIHTYWVDSKLLVGNPAKVPTKRMIQVYLPEGVKQAELGLICLAPWTQAGRQLLEWRPFKESLPARIDRLTQQHQWPNVAVICPDLYTDFGGSQFVDGSYFGPHASVIVREMMPTLSEKLGIRRWGVFGRSSGAFGALRLAMDFPGVFSAVAAHSADLGFATIYPSDLLAIPDRLRRFDSSWQKFVNHSLQSVKLSGGDIHVLMLIAMAGFYSPRGSSIDLPIDLHTGELIEEVWQRWLAADPVMRVAQSREALHSLKYLYVECGLRDQYKLLYGARRLRRQLEEAQIAHRYEEFDDDHSGTDYRYDISLPEMVQRLR